MILPRALPVAITGTGCICGAGNTVERTLHALALAPPIPAPPTRLASLPLEHPVFQANVPRNVSNDPLFDEPGLAFLLHTTVEALAKSGRTPRDVYGKRVGVCVGSSVGFAINHYPLYRSYRAGAPLSEDTLTLFRRSNYALALKEHLGLTGPCQLVANACASGTDAVGIAASWVREGLCDLAIAAGVDSLSCISYLGFIRLMVADKAPCKPFDRDRAGLNLGEGAGALILEPERSPVAALGYVAGYGIASDAYHPTAPHPQGLGLRRAFTQALAQAGIEAQDTAFICVHGTGTRDNDSTEARVLSDMFPGVPFLATKGATGHTLGAAGAIEAVFTVHYLAQGVIPASPGFLHPDPTLPASPTATPQTVDGAVALSDSLAFGGCNSVLAFRRNPE